MTCKRDNTLTFTGGTKYSPLNTTLENIEAFYASDKYVWVVLNTGDGRMLDPSHGSITAIFKMLQDKAPNTPFIEVRRGYVVRLDSISEVNKAFDDPMTLTTRSGYSVRISRRHIANVCRSVKEYKAKAACNLQGEPNGCQENQV